MRTISSLSMPITGRRMGRSVTSPLTARASMVWLATWPRLAGDQSAAVQVLGQGVRQAHHEPAHNQGKMILRAIAANLLLNLGKGNNGDIQPPAPGHQLPGQLEDLFPGLLAGIGGEAKWIISSSTPRLAII